MREKTLNLKKTVELFTQNSYDRRHKQKHFTTRIGKRLKKNKNLARKRKRNNTENNGLHKRKEKQL